jgi:hypothetical protein
MTDGPRWVVKIVWPDGVESVQKVTDEADAREVADICNRYLQTDIYRAEPYDPAKAEGWNLTPGIVAMLRQVDGG